jgi:putative glycosyltransferase (TIGR04372 family)
MFVSLQESAGRSNYHLKPERYPNPATYIKAQEILAGGGNQVVDLWTLVGNPVKMYGESHDSSTIVRDQLQSWLFANCELFLSGASGSWWIAWALGRPTLVTDSYLIVFDLAMSMQVPKLLWDISERRMVTISEMGPRSIDQIRDNLPGRYEVISNTPEEIAEAVIELRAITRGEVEVDAELQARVSQLAHSSFPPGKPAKPMSLMGQGFLRRHPEILA